MIKDFKLKILIFFKFVDHQTLNPFTSNTPYLPHSFTKLSNLYVVGSARWKATNVLWASKKQRNNVWVFELLCVLKYLLTNLSILIAFLLLALHCFIYSFFWKVGWRAWLFDVNFTLKTTWWRVEFLSLSKIILLLDVSYIYNVWTSVGRS